MLQRFLFTHIDNSSLIVFRWAFGLLLFLESVGAIFTGWVKRVMIEPEFTFSFIGLDWLQPLPGYGMYLYYSIMGLLGLMVMLGWFYRPAMTGFTLLWTGTYLMQKSSYNNHYYLLILICFLMIFMPAHRYASMDARRKPGLRSLSMPRWCQVVLIAQIAIAYVYGAVAKLYSHWWNGRFIQIAFENRYDHPMLASVFNADWFQLFVSYSGFFFDLLIIPLLLYRKTRLFAFGASIFFHLFNSAVFQIGIFPYLSLAFCLFFFEPATIRGLFLKSKPLYTAGEIRIPSYQHSLKYFLVAYFAMQLIIPLRHHLIEGNVFWTEEGHRMSWRMMLRSKRGIIRFWVETPESDKRIMIRLSNYLTPKQARAMPTHPDMIWQFAQFLEEEYAARGQEVKVFVNSHVNLNSTGYHQFVDPEVDLAAVNWRYFGHQEWLLPFPGFGNLEKK